MTIPTTPKALRTRITSYRRKLRQEKQQTGYYGDGYGKRLWLFYLYYLFNDLEEAAEYMVWYQREFPDDGGPASQHICWSLMLHRMGHPEAVYHLAYALSENIQCVETLLGRYEGPYGIWGEETMGMDLVPEEVSDAVTDEELDWINAQFEEPGFDAYRTRVIEIGQALEGEREYERRVALGEEARRLLEGFRG